MKPNPFNLDEDSLYKEWRDGKLSGHHRLMAQPQCAIEDPYHLKQEELATILDLCDRKNYVIYQIDSSKYTDKSLVHALGQQIGLSHLDTNLRADEDSITSLEVRDQVGNQYIPYTDKPLSWHCDGYYNDSEHQVRGIIMHCVRPAAEGGVNRLLDHELLYIKLRDDNPDYIRCLMDEEVMTIPANIENGVEIRAEQKGPVFSTDPTTGRLHMRYSARKTNISWKDDDLTNEALSKISSYLADADLATTYRLEAGQGIICNNVLHNRTGFADSENQQRLMYRARYYDRVNTPGI